MLTTILLVLGSFSLLAGLLGCVLPILPGPPLSWLGLLFLSWAYNWEPFSALFLVVMAGMAIAATVLDYVVPAMGAKRVGASREGVFMSIVGMIVGTVFFPPFGMILGALVGAFVGEILIGRTARQSTKAAVGVFLGTLFGIVLKLIASGVMTFYFVRELWARI